LLHASFECAFRQACSVSRHTLHSVCARAVVLMLLNPKQYQQDGQTSHGQLSRLYDSITRIGIV